jgi:Carboxypeptidase regulatory-like domain
VLARPGVWGVALAAGVLAGPVSATASTRSAVLAGTVLVAPATPVCMPRVPCMRPAAGVVLAFRRGGAVRARVTTGKDGHYRVALAPGSYGVRVTRPTGVRRLRPDAVTVSAGQVKQLTFYLDTGIR